MNAELFYKWAATSDAVFQAENMIKNMKKCASIDQQLGIWNEITGSHHPQHFLYKAIDWLSNGRKNPFNIVFHGLLCPILYQYGCSSGGGELSIRNYMIFLIFFFQVSRQKLLMQRRQQ